MNKKIFILLFLLPLFTGCRNSDHSSGVVSMQMIDRNGFSETISNSDRLNKYETVDFLTSQPYQKVLRVYKKDKEGKSPSKLTSYHPNGGVWQYLEAVDGRAHGRFIEWHANGKVKIQAIVIEGMADLNETAQKSWLFDQECTVWDEEGNLQASFFYDKGLLEGLSKYYYPSGKIEKTIPYTKNVIDGPVIRYDEEGNLLEEIPYEKGRKEGSAIGYFSLGVSMFQEEYKEGLLINGTYLDPKGNIIAEIRKGSGNKAEFQEGYLHHLIEYKNGIPEGEIQFFSPCGKLQSSYSVLDGKKTGEEWEYYPPKGKKLLPKLLIQWSENQIQGMVKTWYPNGTLESQREMTQNKKQGLSLAYYKSGDLMFMEEYENDRLIKGSYYKKGEKTPVSSIEKGEGIATLYSADGEFLKKIPYENSKPVVD